MIQRTFNVQAQTRQSNLPWTGVQVEESPPGAGTFVLIDTVAITPDPDPSTAETYTVETYEAQLDPGDYRLRFVDANGVTGDYTPTIRLPAAATVGGGMPLPTGEDIRAWAPPSFNWTSFGFPPVTPPATDPLTVRVSWAAGTLYAVTGRTLQSIVLPEEQAIAQKVLTALVLMEALGGGKAALKVLEAPWLKSFTAGSYSETRFSPSEIAGGGSGKAPPYPAALWALLWALMTEDKRADWDEQLTGRVRPAGAFIPVDWDGDGGGLPSMVWGQGLQAPWE